MESKKGKILSLTAILSLVGNPAVELGDAAKRAFDEFFSGSVYKDESMPQNNSLVNMAYADNLTSLLNSLDAKVQFPTNWSPEDLRQTIRDDKLTFVYWRWEGRPYMEKGDRFFRDILRDYGSWFDRVVLIESSKYSLRDIKAIKDVLNEFNKSEQSYTHKSPIYSITGFGKEVRIRGPPGDPYEKDYSETYKNGFEKFLPQFKAKK